MTPHERNVENDSRGRRRTDMEPYYLDDFVTVLNGDALECIKALPDGSVQCCVTSPPYWGLRDYGEDGQMGLESTPEEYVAGMVAVFREVRRVLADDGTLWLNLGDSYNGVGRGDKANGLQIAARATKQRTVSDLKPKDLVGIPWRVAFALQADGWYLRSDIIWAKPNPMPESVRDRPTKAHEYIFLLSKSERYHYDTEAVAEPLTKGDAGSQFHTGNTGAHQMGRSSAKPRRSGNKARKYGEDRDRPGSNMGASIPWEDTDGTRNRRTVWQIATKPYAAAHFATFPREIPETCIKAGCPAGGTVLDPFGGAGTTAWIAKELGRRVITIELSPEYCDLIARRCGQHVLDFGGVT